VTSSENAGHRGRASRLDFLVNDDTYVEVKSPLQNPQVPLGDRVRTANTRRSTLRDEDRFSTSEIIEHRTNAVGPLFQRRERARCDRVDASRSPSGRTNSHLLNTHRYQIRVTLGNNVIEPPLRPTPARRHRHVCAVRNQSAGLLSFGDLVTTTGASAVARGVAEPLPGPHDGDVSVPESIRCTSPELTIDQAGRPVGVGIGDRGEHRLPPCTPRSPAAHQPAGRLAIQALRPLHVERKSATG
jgi:hypothetical protein